jgi:hypothetical protein
MKIGTRGHTGTFWVVVAVSSSPSSTRPSDGELDRSFGFGGLPKSEAAQERERRRKGETWRERVGVIYHLGMARRAMFDDTFGSLTVRVSINNRSSLAHELGGVELNKGFATHRPRMSFDSGVSTDQERL